MCIGCVKLKHKHILTNSRNSLKIVGSNTANNMNIFALSDNPIQAAQWHTDSHCIKMILETAQLLCAVFHIQDDVYNIPYKLTHKNHPCAKWCRESSENFEWTLALGNALCKEYTERYGRIHKTQAVLEWVEHNKHLLRFSKVGRTPFALAMPDEYKTDCPFQSYRNYYIAGKKHLHKWRQHTPHWIN